MVPAELDLLSIGIGSVSAPAGCGKTHLIVDAIRRHSGPRPILVLTHTNAGVAALRGRLEQARIAREKYRVYTIDGWVMRLIAMFPNNAGHDPAVLDLGMPNRDYPAIRHAADTLLSAGHLDDVIASSYERLIVDEYQDCLVVQHRLIEHLARVLPAVVLGDPLQAIFGFANNRLVDWADDVETTFPVAGSLPHSPEIGPTAPGTASVEEVVEEDVSMVGLEQIGREVSAAAPAEIAFGDQQEALVGGLAEAGTVKHAAGRRVRHAAKHERNKNNHQGFAEAIP